MSWAALLLASALLIGGDSRPRVRAGLTAAEPRRRSTASGASDPLAAASSFDVLAACLRCGMAVSTAASATAPSAPAPLARMLNRAADLLALGAEPATAWTNLPGRAQRTTMPTHCCGSPGDLRRRERPWRKELPNWPITLATKRPMLRAQPPSGPRC